MSSLRPELKLLSTPNGKSLGVSLNEITVTKVNTTDLTVTGSINGYPIGSDFVFLNAVQTLTNKSFADSSVNFINGTDTTTKISFDVAGAPGTAATIKAVQTLDRTYTIPDSGANSDFVMTNGDQTINGTKTFAELGLENLTMNGGTTRFLANGAATTVGATDDILYPVVTLNNVSYLLQYDIVGATSTGNTAIFRASIRAKNDAGTLTLSDVPFDIWSSMDSALAGANASYVVFGATIRVTVTGVAGQTIAWGGLLKVISQEWP
jgi:hypothetical protein